MIMKKVKDLLYEFNNLDLYSKYGMYNIISDLYTIGKEKFLLLEDDDFLNKEISFDDLVKIVKKYQDTMCYKITNIIGDDVYFEFTKTDKDGGKLNQGGHVISNYKPFNDTVKRIEQFICSNGGSGDLNKSVSPHNTKNVNPFVLDYQKCDMYIIASNIVSTITTKKFNTNFSGIFPDFENYYSYFYYFEYIQENHNNKEFLYKKKKHLKKDDEIVVDDKKDNDDKIDRPNHHFGNFNKRITWFIKEGSIVRNDLYELEYFNIILHISEVINNTQNIKTDSNFKDDILKCDWYEYSTDSFMKYNVDYLFNKIIYDNYRNTQEYFNDFKYHNDYKTYKTLIGFLKNMSYQNMNKVLSKNIVFNENNKMINEYKNKLNMDSTKRELVTKLGKNISYKIYCVYKDKYKNDKNFLNDKVLTLKSAITKNIDNAKNILDLFEYLRKLSKNHKTNIINISIDEFYDINEEEFKIFKQLLNIIIYTKYDIVSSSQEEYEDNNGADNIDISLIEPINNL